MIVLLVALHSLLEYPLWYGYFLLPAAFALGLNIGSESHRAGSLVHDSDAPFVQRDSSSSSLLICGALMVAGSIHAVLDYGRVAVIFQPGGSTMTLPERIEDGKRSVYFAHHAYYAEATTAAQGSQVMPAFDVASYFLLDTRLMMAWARAYAQAGDLARARHLSDRLREFHNAASSAFFEECDKPRAEGLARPFQCEASSASLDHRDFP